MSFSLLVVTHYSLQQTEQNLCFTSSSTIEPLPFIHSTFSNAFTKPGDSPSIFVQTVIGYDPRPHNVSENFYSSQNLSNKDSSLVRTISTVLTTSLPDVYHTGIHVPRRWHCMRILLPSSEQRVLESFWNRSTARRTKIYRLVLDSVRRRPSTAMVPNWWPKSSKLIASAF